MPLDLEDRHRALILAILVQHVPDREVWAFGSRVKGTAVKHSDLDLAILGDEPLPLAVVGALADALSESNLPFQVDIVDWARISEAFRAIVRAGHVVLREG